MYGKLVCNIRDVFSRCRCPMQNTPLTAVNETPYAALCSDESTFGIPCTGTSKHLTSSRCANGMDPFRYRQQVGCIRTCNSCSDACLRLGPRRDGLFLELLKRKMQHSTSPCQWHDGSIASVHHVFEPSSYAIRDAVDLTLIAHSHKE